MEAVVIAFALGAGAVLAVKRGKRTRRTVARAIGWAAEQAGFVSGRVSEGIAEARRIARDRYRQGREANAARVEMGRAAPSSLAPPSSRGDGSARAEGAVEPNGQAR
jgi:hypothetical protein